MPVLLKCVNGHGTDQPSYLPKQITEHIGKILTRKLEKRHVVKQLCHLRQWPEADERNAKGKTMSDNVTV